VSRATRAPSSCSGEKCDPPVIKYSSVRNLSALLFVYKSHQHMDHIRHGSKAKGRLPYGGMHGPIQQGDPGASSSGPNYALWLSGPGSAGHLESIPPEFSTVRDFWLYSGLGYDLCRCAGLAGHAPASLKRRHAPKDGGHHGSLSDPLGLLWLVDCFSTRDCMERDCCLNQFVERRRVPPFRPHRKSQARKLASYSAGDGAGHPWDQQTST